MEILVAGMHRSGTSVVAAVINMLGVSGGPVERLAAPAFDNQKGFWERFDVSRLNDDILALYGCRWFDVHGFSNSALKEPIDGTLHERAVGILSEFDASQHWLIKDPRFCLTLPFWERLLSAPVVVVPYRDPREVAASLNLRDLLSLSHAAALWEFYNVQALKATVQRRRILVGYEALIRDPLGSCLWLYDQLREAGVDGLAAPTADGVNGIIDAGLRHQLGGSDPLGSVFITEAQRELMRYLQSGAPGGSSGTETPDLSPSADQVLREIHLWRARAEEGASTAAVSSVENSVRSTSATDDRAMRYADVMGADQDQVGSGLELAGDSREGISERRARSGPSRDHILRQFGALEARQEHLLLLVDSAWDEIWRLRSRLISLLQPGVDLDDRLQDVETAVRRMIVDGEEQSSFRDRLRMLWTRASGKVPGWKKQLLDDVVSARVRVRSLARRALGEAGLGATLVDGDFLGRRPSPSLTSRIGHGTENARERNRRFDILILGDEEWGGRQRREKCLAVELAKLGHRVIYVSRFLRSASGPSAGFKKLATPSENLHLYALQHDDCTKRDEGEQPFADRWQVLAASLARLCEDQALETRVTLIEHEFWLPIVPWSRFGPVIFDGGARQQNVPYSADRPLKASKRQSEGQAIDGVIQLQEPPEATETSPSHVAHVPNGADWFLYQQTAPTAPDGGGTVIGVLSRVLDQAQVRALCDAAAALPEWTFIIPSTHESGSLAFSGLENVHSVGEYPELDRPALLARFDIGVIPPAAAARAPGPSIEVYEALACGLPVVLEASDAPDSIREHVWVCGNSPDAFVQGLKAAVADSNLRSPGCWQTRRDWAQKQGWLSRARHMAAFFDSLLPSVSVILVLYNNLALTKACLASLEAWTRYQRWSLIVIDNASSDGTQSFLTSYASENGHVHFIENTSNLGFAAAVNQGLAAATGDYVVILNNDIYVTPGWLYGLIRHLMQDETLGLIGPVTNAIANEARIELTYRSMTEMLRESLRTTADSYGVVMRTEMIAFFCVAGRRRLFQQVGPLDEGFGTGYFEDDDYCRRVGQSGLGVAIARDVFIHHEFSASFNQLPDHERERLFATNKKRFEEKWGQWTPYVRSR